MIFSFQLLSYSYASPAQPSKYKKGFGVMAENKTAKIFAHLTQQALLMLEMCKDL